MLKCVIEYNSNIIMFLLEDLMNNAMNENFISIEDAAAFLNIKPVTLRKWIRDNNVPAHKIGKQWKFLRSELEEWVRSGKSASL